MRIIGPLVAGVVGGLVGGAVWVAVSHYLNFELGWIAWGIGAIVGASVHAAALGQGGRGLAVLAVAIAVACLLGAKLVTLHLDLGGGGGARYDVAEHRDILVSYLADVAAMEREEAGEAVAWPAGAVPYEGEAREDYPAEIWAQGEQRWAAMSAGERRDMAINPPAYLDTEFMISFLADDIALEREETGAPVQWPAGVEPYSGSAEADYPPDVWAAAATAWAGMSPEEHATFRGGHVQEISITFLDTVRLLPWAFSLWDVLWFALAIATAWGLAAREADGVDAADGADAASAP